MGRRGQDPAATPHEEPIDRWGGSYVPRNSHYPVNLPVASMAFEDMADDCDDRLIVTLAVGGRLYAGERETTLQGLADTLGRATTAYNEKTRGDGFVAAWAEGPRWSKLYLLLRADREVPLHQLRSVIAEVRAAWIFKVQLATRSEPSEDITPEEGARALAGREVRPVCGLDHKILFFLPTGGGTPAKASFDLRAAVERGEGVASLVRELDRLRSEGTDKVDLLSIEAALESSRHTFPLPPEWAAVPPGGSQHPELQFRRLPDVAEMVIATYAARAPSAPRYTDTLLV